MNERHNVTSDMYVRQLAFPFNTSTINKSGSVIVGQPLLCYDIIFITPYIVLNEYASKYEITWETI